jgi:hypothetical protein
MGTADRFEAFIIGEAHTELTLQIRARPAIDRLAEVGAAYRARAALERGLRDGQRLLNGEVSADDLSQELGADPP